MHSDTVETITIGAVGKGRGSEVRVSLSVPHNLRSLDIRVFASWDESLGLRATKRGVTVRIEQLRALRSLLAEAENEAVARGWLSPEGGAA